MRAELCLPTWYDSGNLHKHTLNRVYRYGRSRSLLNFWLSTMNDELELPATCAVQMREKIPEKQLKFDCGGAEAEFSAKTKNRPAMNVVGEEQKNTSSNNNSKAWASRWCLLGDFEPLFSNLLHSVLCHSRSLRCRLEIALIDGSICRYEFRRTCFVHVSVLQLRPSCLSNIGLTVIDVDRTSSILRIHFTCIQFKTAFTSTIHYLLWWFEA